MAYLPPEEGGMQHPVIPVVDLDQARENLALLTQMMVGTHAPLLLPANF